MADDARHARPALEAAIEDTAEMDFFELLRQLETAQQRFGRAGGPRREPARLGQAARLGFAASDIARIDVPDAERPPQVSVNVIGLLGPEGPMPLHLTRWVMNRLSNRWFAGGGGETSDTTFLDFANLLQHRMMALYWRAWADARAEVHVAHGSGGRVSALARALAGLGLPETETGDRRIDGPKLHHATSLVQEARSPERLTTFLETVLGLPVQLAEFTGAWVDIPGHLQTRLGAAHAGLGTQAVAGARVFDRASRAEIRIGPLAQEEFTAFLDDPGRWERLRHAVIFASGKDLHFSLRLVLAPGEAPAARLGAARLGRTAWLAPDPERAADDLCFSGIADHDAPASERRAA